MVPDVQQTRKSSQPFPSRELRKTQEHHHAMKEVTTVASQDLAAISIWSTKMPELSASYEELSGTER